MFVLLFCLFSSTLHHLQLPPSSLPHHHFTILHHLLLEPQTYANTQQWSFNLLTALQFCRCLLLLYHIYSSCITPGPLEHISYNTKRITQQATKTPCRVPPSTTAHPFCRHLINSHFPLTVPHSPTTSSTPPNIPPCPLNQLHLHNRESALSPVCSCPP